MYRRFFHISLVLFLFANFIFAQDDIQNLTLSVIDTNSSQYQQTREIFYWVTKNISYDLKAYKKYEINNLTPSEVLKNRKGVCADFSSLVTDMCHSAGIEAYTIHGYVKTYPYFKDKPYIRAEHAWNVVYADSSWIIIDATWGSGYLSTKPSFFSKALYFTFRIPYGRGKFVFIPEQTFKYFDISPDSLIKTHYPLDPKWLFSETPLSFYYFEKDSLPKFTEFTTYKSEINSVRGMSYNSALVIEGINGNFYNKHNYFDLANGYSTLSQTYDIERPVNEGNLWQFEKYNKDYFTIITAINRHKIINDSIYRLRSKSLKTLASDQKKLTSKIKTKAKAAKKSFKSGKKQILGKNTSYKKKQDAYSINIGRADLKRIPGNTNADSVVTDLEEIEILNSQINELFLQEPSAILSADSLLQHIDKQFNADALYDDTIFAKNNTFNFNIVSLSSMIQTGDEIIIRNYVDSLKINYSEILSLFEEKKETKSKLQETSKEYYVQTGLYQKLVKEQIALLGKIYKLSNNKDSIAKIHNSRIDELVKSYKQSILFTRKLADHTMLQKEIREDNLYALNQQRKNINRENKFFLAWYKHLYKFESDKFLSEKELIKTIKSNAQNGLNITETKIKKFNTSSAKP